MYILTETDKEQLINAYNKVTNSSELNQAKQKIDWAIRNVQLSDVFLAGRLNEMITDNPDKMVRTNIPTMETDGHHLFYSPKFVNTLTVDEVAFVVAHELLHCALGHHKAFKDVPKNDENLWTLVNIATDLSINDLLKTRGMPHGILMPGEGNYANMPKGLDARDYFVRLLKKYTPTPPPLPPPPPDNPRPKEDDKDKDQDNGDDSEDTKNDSETGDGDEKTDEEGGDESGGDSGQDGQGGDDGGDESGQAGDASSGETGTTKGIGKGKGSGKETTDKPDISDPGTVGTTKETYDKIEKQLEIPKHIIDQTQKTGEIKSEETTGGTSESLDQYEQRMERESVEAGNIEKKREEAGIQTGSGQGSRSLIDKNYRDLFKQKSNLPWRNILANFLQLSERSERTYRVTNTRFTSFAKDNKLLFPGYKDEKLKDLVFLVDVSGSMPRSACEKIFGEIAAVSNTKSFGQQSNIILISFDDGIISEDVFSQNTHGKFKSVEHPEVFIPKQHIHKLPLSETTFSSFKWSDGGGGTTIKPALINLQKIKPTLVVVLTDGWFTGDDVNFINNQKIPYQIIWLMTTDKRFEQGKTYNLNDYNYML